MKRPARSIVYFVLPSMLLASLAGCGQRREPPVGGDLPVVSVVIGAREFTLEVAATNTSRQKGLMQRDSMPADHGMLFIFPDEQPRSFWMKNTRIPLDIIFLDASGKVDSVKSMKAYDLSSTPSDGPARYAIELNAGQAAQAGVAKGQVIDLPLDDLPAAEQ